MSQNNKMELLIIIKMLMNNVNCLEEIEIKCLSFGVAAAVTVVTVLTIQHFQNSPKMKKIHFIQIQRFHVRNVKKAKNEWNALLMYK